MKTYNNHILIRGLAIALIAVFAISCGVRKRSYDKVQNSIPDVLSENYLEMNDSTALFQAIAPDAEWWTNFNDPDLDSLINKARQKNLNIRTAIANYESAQALLKGTKFDRFPTITSNGNFTRQRLGENVFVSGGNPTFNQYNGSLDAFWEIGAFGRVSNRIKGAVANREIARADIRGVYVSIFAEIANNYISLRGAQYQLNIANENLRSQEQTLDLVTRQFEAGTGNNLNVSRAAAQMESTKATIPALQAQIEALKNSISVLVGEIPGDLDDAYLNDKPLPDLPNTISMGNVYELIQRRPDVQLAENQVKAQIAQYNLSVAELYPNITFSGSIGFSAINFSSFGQNEAFTWNLMPRISWAAFNLGRVKKQIDAEDAATLGAIAQYEQVILQALEDIRTSMSNYVNLLRKRESLRKAAESSNDAVTFAQQRYDAGLDSFIDYLNANRTLLEAENELAIIETQTATGLVQLYRALGGGWGIITEEETQNIFNTIKEKDSTYRGRN